MRIAFAVIQLKQLSGYQTSKRRGFPLVRLLLTPLTATTWRSSCWRARVIAKHLTTGESYAQDYRTGRRVLLRVGDLDHSPDERRAEEADRLGPDGAAAAWLVLSEGHALLN